MSSAGGRPLVPDKAAAYGQIFRVLRPGGRFTISDICVEHAVPEQARRDVDLWVA